MQNSFSLPLFLKNNYPFILLVIAPLLWAGNFLTGKIIHGTIPPFTFAFFRWVLVSLFLFPFIRKELWQQRAAILKHIPFIALLGLLGITLYTALVYWSLNYTTVVNAALINATIPAIILLISWIFFHGTITLRQVVGIAASIIGVLFIITQAKFSVLIHLSIDRGEAIMLVAVVAWALYSILLNYIPIKISPFLFLFVMSVPGVIFLFPCFLSEYLQGQVMQVSAKSVGGLLYTVFFASTLAYTCWSLGVGKLGANKAAPFYNLLSVFSAILAILFLGEPFHFYHVLGIIFVFVGIYLSTFKIKKKEEHYCASGCPNENSFNHLK